MRQRRVRGTLPRTHVLRICGCSPSLLPLPVKNGDREQSAVIASLASRNGGDCFNPDREDHYPSATASLHGWNGSTAPLLVGPSRSTTLGQANFIGMVWMRASS